MDSQKQKIMESLDSSLKQQKTVPERNPSAAPSEIRYFVYAAIVIALLGFPGSLVAYSKAQKSLEHGFRYVYDPEKIEKEIKNALSDTLRVIQLNNNSIDNMHSLSSESSESSGFTTYQQYCSPGYPKAKLFGYKPTFISATSKTDQKDYFIIPGTKVQIFNTHTDHAVLIQPSKSSDPLNPCRERCFDGDSSAAASSHGLQILLSYKVYDGTVHSLRYQPAFQAGVYLKPFSFDGINPEGQDIKNPDIKEKIQQLFNIFSSKIE